MKQQALLVIDLQNDFTRAEGKLPACTAEVDDILPLVNAAVAHWHAHGRPVLVLTTVGQLADALVDQAIGRTGHARCCAGYAPVGRRSRTIGQAC